MPDPREDREANLLVRRIAAFGSPGTDAGESLVVEERCWPAFHRILTSQQLEGLAVAAATAGSLVLTDDQQASLLDATRDAMLWCLEIEKNLVGLTAAFAHARIDFLVLKGPAVAHTLYPDPSWRPFRDLDLLVRTRDWKRASETLISLGYRRFRPEPRPGFDERFGKAAVHLNDQGLNIDLHRTLVLGPFGLWMDPEMMFASAERFELAGRSFYRCSRTTMLLNACMHAALGSSPPLLLPLRDVVQASNAPGLDWNEVEEHIDRWKLPAVMQLAVESAEEELGVTLPQQVVALGGRRSSRRERRALAAYLSDRRTRGGTARATLLAIPGVRAKVRYLSYMLVPTREFLATGGNQRPSYFRRWSVLLRWFVSRVKRHSRHTAESLR